MFSEVILIGRRTRFLAYVSCFPCLFVSEENPPSPSESAYEDDGTTGTVYEQVKEETVGSNQSDDGDSVTKEQGDDNGEGVEGVTVPVGIFYGGKGVTSKVPSTPSGKHTDVNKKDGKSKVPSTLSGEHTDVNKKDGKSKVPSTLSGEHTDVNKKDGKSKVPSTLSGEHTDVNKKDGKSKVPSTPSGEHTDVDKTTRPKSKNTPTPQPSEGATNIGATALTFAPFHKKVDTMERRMTDTISVSMQSVQGSLTSVNTKSDALDAWIGGIEDSLQGITNKSHEIRNT